MDHHEHHHPDPPPTAIPPSMQSVATSPTVVSVAARVAPTSHASHDAHAGHNTGMSHDMSDPAMAASMETDIRKRFWVALVLSALVVVISPMGEMLGIHLPLSTTVRSWTLLALTTPIVFWCGWIFIAG